MRYDKEIQQSLALRAEEKMRSGISQELSQQFLSQSAVGSKISPGAYNQRVSKTPPSSRQMELPCLLYIPNQYLNDFYLADHNCIIFREASPKDIPQASQKQHSSLFSLGRQHLMIAQFFDILLLHFCSFSLSN